jgi:hypothetical protein
MNNLRIPEGEFTAVHLAEANPLFGSLTIRVLLARAIAEGRVIQTKFSTGEEPAAYKAAETN